MVEKEGKEGGEEGKPIDEDDPHREEEKFMEVGIGEFSDACTISDKDDEKEVDENDEHHIMGMDLIRNEVEFFNRCKGH